MKEGNEKSAVIGGIVREALKRSDMNQTKLAVQIGIDQSSLSQFLSGKADLPLKRFIQMIPILKFEGEEVGRVLAAYGDELDLSPRQTSAVSDVLVHSLGASEDKPIPRDDFNLARINEIYTCLDRAGRAELLASAEQILKRNTPIIPAPGTMRINTDLTSENLPPKIPTELVARMVQEMDNPTSTPRGKFKGRWLLDKSFICPACRKKFFVSRTESGAKMACPLCGQHVIIP